MRSPRRLPRALALSALVSVILAASLATADDPPGSITGRWRERRGWSSRRTDVTLAPGEGGTWTGEVRGPRSDEPYRMTLRRAATGRWVLVIEKRVKATVGASGVLEGRDASGWAWGEPREVALEVEDGRLKGGGFDFPTPSEPAATTTTAPVSTTSPTTTTPGGALGDPPPVRPVRVLITGFDRFPLLRNHPSRYWSGEMHWSEPDTNPAGWAVRNFDCSTLDPALVRQAPIEVHRMLDLVVHYVDAGERVAREIARLDADVCISFGVGSDCNADADVETTCFNRMNDGGTPFGREGEGPWQIPASWPPREDERWSTEDTFWRSRYPDNAGVSYEGKSIDPREGARLSSSLPVQAIVRRAEREGLEAHDGQGGPGEYVCNSVMFKVVQTQTARGRIGGFVHLAQWDDRRRESYLTVVRIAVEESARAVIASRASR